MTIPASIATLRSDLNRAFLERRREIDGLLVALLAEEHVLLLGPPGTAKSALAQALVGALDGRYFQRLLTPFSVPEELFGPFSLSALQADQYVRQVDGYLPTADVAFLDECFKANSAILNALLTALNERSFDQGSQRISIPLKLTIGASNELPQDDVLAALYDRFSVRFWIDPVKSRDSRRALIEMAGAPKVTAKVTADELDAMLDLHDALARECQIVVSDRRLRKCVRLVQARAALDGRAVASLRDLEILAESLWNKPDERSAIYGQVLTVAAPNRANAQAIVDAATEAMAKIDLSKIDVSNLGAAAKTLREIRAMATEVRGLGDDVTDLADVIDGYVSEITRATTKALGS
jgi:MoxR-like ATPase